MNFRHKITLSLLLYTVLSSTTFANVVGIPDPNLRAAIREQLNLKSHVDITEDIMRELTSLGARRRGITSLEGLQYAVRLQDLSLWGEPLHDLTPLRNLYSLKRLSAGGCRISDISPLSGLTWLNRLSLSENRIRDLKPLSNLKRISTLKLDDNQIRDVRPIAGLPKLKYLEIHDNLILDHSPLNHIDFEHFTYDETCDMPPLPLQPRLENRAYPRIFTAWGDILNQPHLPPRQRGSLHDLAFGGLLFGHRYVYLGGEWLVRGEQKAAVAKRDESILYNPDTVFIVEIRMRDAKPYYFPEDSPYWIRDEHGNRKGDEYLLIDFTHPEVQDIIVEQAIAVDKCGLYDGIFLDWWKEIKTVLRGGSTFEAEQRARDNILERIRANTRPDFLILVNTNRRIIPRTGPFINGGFMETGVPAAEIGDELEASLNKIEDSLFWLDTNLREPRINSLEGETIPTEPPDSPNNLRWMRAITTMSLTHSDGYVVFAIHPGHDHYWYDFWDADLGQPVGEKGQRYQGTDGLYIREFTNGWAVYNHSGESQEITLPELVAGVASGVEGTTHTLPNLDGEMYLRAKPVNPADVNGDGVINIFDLTLVAQAIGTGDGQGDVNEDGVVNVFDLVFVAGAIGGGGAAPSAYSLDSSIISAADVERWLAQTQGLGVGDANFQRGIRFLEGLLAALTPKETTLLPNYPNPFNPETWIPYRLAREAEVAITIYDTKGTLVRRLALGNQAAGYYAERGKAAYWDGRNEDGEAVASGIYIYQFRAGDYAASRRMVIVK